MFDMVDKSDDTSLPLFFMKYACSALSYIETVHYIGVFTTIQLDGLCQKN
jgi:hypothetical protein